MQKTLGGDRLGSGHKQKVYLHGYERSTHDLGYLWRTTMSAGTLVPFMKQNENNYGSKNSTNSNDGYAEKKSTYQKQRKNTIRH